MITGYFNGDEVGGFIAEEFGEVEEIMVPNYLLGFQGFYFLFAFS